MRRYTLKCEAKQKAGPRASSRGSTNRSGGFLETCWDLREPKAMKKTYEVLGIFEYLWDFLEAVENHHP